MLAVGSIPIARSNTGGGVVTMVVAGRPSYF